MWEGQECGKKALPCPDDLRHSTGRMRKVIRLRKLTDHRQPFVRQFG